MTGFEPRTLGIGSDCSTNWATTTAQNVRSTTFKVGVINAGWIDIFHIDMLQKLYWSLLEKTENKQKVAGVGPFKKRFVVKAESRQKNLEPTRKVTFNFRNFTLLWIKAFWLGQILMWFASDARDPRFESSLLSYYQLYYKRLWKNENKAKRGLEWPNF